MVKWLSAVGLGSNKWRWWVWTLVACRWTTDQSLLAWSKGWRPPGAFCIHHVNPVNYHSCRIYITRNYYCRVLGSMTIKVFYLNYGLRHCFMYNGLKRSCSAYVTEECFDFILFNIVSCLSTHFYQCSRWCCYPSCLLFYNASFERHYTCQLSWRTAVAAVWRMLISLITFIFTF